MLRRAGIPRLAPFCLAALLLLALGLGVACRATPLPTPSPTPTAALAPADPTLDPLWRGATTLQRAYVDTGLAELDSLVRAALTVLAEAADMPTAELQAAMAQVEGPVPENVPPGLEEVWRAWTVVRAVQAQQDEARLMARVLEAMLAATGDEYAEVFAGTDTEQAREYFQGAYEGIGAVVSMREGRVVIIELRPGGPAELAGLRRGDVVLAVDGEPVEGASLAEVVGRTRGPAGTPVTLLVEREGVQMEVTVQRSEIVEPVVATDLLPNGIGYLIIGRFTDRTGEETREALRELLSAGARALLLDLRGNPGGTMPSAVTVISQFVGEGLAYYEESLDGERTDHPVEPGGIALDVPLAVLVDSETLSAAEAVAGALQDHGRARVFGTATGGKGTLLVLQDVGGGIGVYALAGYWSTPNGRNVNGVGLQPDEVVHLTREDLVLGRDRQVLTAYAYLREVVERLATPTPSPAV